MTSEYDAYHAMMVFKVEVDGVRDALIEGVNEADSRARWLRDALLTLNRHAAALNSLAVGAKLGDGGWSPERARRQLDALAEQCTPRYNRSPEDVVVVLAAVALLRSRLNTLAPAATTHSRIAEETRG